MAETAAMSTLETKCTHTPEEQTYIDAQRKYEQMRKQHTDLYVQVGVVTDHYKNAVLTLTTRCKLGLMEAEPHIAVLKQCLEIREMLHETRYKLDAAASALSVAKVEAFNTRNAMIVAYGFKALEAHEDLNL